MYNNFSEDLFSCSHQKSLHEIKIKHIAEGRDLVDLSMINPDMQPERILLDKLLEATVKNTNHRYSVSKGIKRLRAAFAHKYSTAFSVNLNHDKNICITMGSKDAIVNTMLVLSAEYKYALLPSPTYPALLSAVHLAGMQPVYYDICLSEDLILKEIEEKIKKVGKAVLVLNFPNNPSGKTVTADFYMGLKKILKGSDTVVLNDFVYGEMGFDGSRQTSLLSIFAEHPLLLESYSLSKAYSIPGWRVGAVMGNASFIEKLANLKSHMDYGVFLPLQIAACTALQDNVIADNTAQKYWRRYRLLESNIKKLGWRVRGAEAGAALWAELPDSLMQKYKTSMNFCLSLLSQKGILLSPGIIFGQTYNNYVRIALVASEEKLFEVSEELADFISAGLRTEAEDLDAA